MYMYAGICMYVRRYVCIYVPLHAWMPAGLDACMHACMLPNNRRKRGIRWFEGELTACLKLKLQSMTAGTPQIYGADVPVDM